MKAWHVLLTVAFIVSTLASSVSAQTPKGAADSTLLALVGRARSGDTTIDFTALRLAYAHSSFYDPISAARADLRSRLNAALGTENSRAAASLVDSILANTYIDIHAHVLAAALAHAAGDSVAARVHASIARGLLRSFDSDKKGARAAAPIIIVTSDEEEAFGMAKGLERTDRYNTAECGVRVCDSVVFHDPRTDRDTTIVFDITLISNRTLER